MKKEKINNSLRLPCLPYAFNLLLFTLEIILKTMSLIVCCYPVGYYTQIPKAKLQCAVQNLF